MEYRKIATGMIEATYEYYKEISVNEDKEGYGLTLDEFLESYDIAVWNDMDNNTKSAAIEYVYNKRNEIELHSGYAEAWVQATAYFLINNFTVIWVLQILAYFLMIWTLKCKRLMMMR